MSKCPVCGSNGEDLVFKFYCSNPLCQNADIDRLRSHAANREIKDLMLHMWQIYSIGETLEEFTKHFFSSGGEISFSHDDKELMRPTIVEPEWLQDRMSKIL